MHSHILNNPLRNGFKMKTVISVLLALLTTHINEVNSLNILGIFPYQGKSHFFVFEPYLRELVKRGHNITVISYFPQKLPIQNYTDISLARKEKIYEDVFDVEQTWFSLYKMGKGFIDNSLENCKTLLADENVQHLWKSRAKFDLVLVEAFFGDCSLGLAYKLGAPTVALTTHVMLVHHFDRFGVPYQFLQLGPAPTFIKRLGVRLLFETVKLLSRWTIQSNEQEILATYFDDVPPLEELGREIKLILLYTNRVLFGPKAWPENVKEVGGYHVAKSKPLPDKLREFIEQSEHGVIFISFGSMLKAATISKQKVEAVIAALSELPQRVVWKWEEESLPGNPQNIYVAKWLPQNDILAHPNVVAFYSHCGLLGITEALHHGVPIVGMPVFAEQPVNAMAVEEKGFGVLIQFNKLTKDTLLEKFRIVLDPEFRRRAKEISREWHDRPLSPMDAAVYWTEYAVRHPNSTLRIPAVGMPYYQLNAFDVIFIVICFPLLLVFTIIYLFFGRRKTKSKLD